MKPKIESDVKLSVITELLWQKGVKDKNHPGQNLLDKKPGQNSPNKNLRELKQTPCKDICMYTCATKNRGRFEMCDVL